MISNKMDVNFETLRKEYKIVLSKAFKTENLGLLENKIKSFTRTDFDIKTPLDQAFRDFLLDLLEEEVSVGTLKSYVEFCVQSCRDGFCTPTMPVVLLGDIFEALTLDMCEEMFQFVEDNVQIWKEELFFAGCKNNLLRLCNDLLRRLSRSTATVFCGKILLFLAKFFPFSERSGLNIVSEFNLENITEYGRDPNDDIVTEIATNDSQKNIVIDYNFYCKFWNLQDFFRNPNQCYNKVHWKQFCSNSSSILNAFQGIKLDYVTANENLKSNKNLGYFAKYLTSQKLLDLQLYDVNFRRSVLIQFLIVFQYLTSSVKFKSDSFELKSDQKEWIQTHKEKVFNLLKETPPDGGKFAEITQKILEREELWNAWKNEGCPEMKKPSADAVMEIYPQESRPLLGDILKKAKKENKFYMGSGELTRLWNQCPDNLEACKAKDRDFLPSLEDYFGDVIDQIESKSDSKEENPTLKDPNFGWRALRLLAKRSPHFFTYTNTITPTLSLYLDSMVKKIMQERPGRNSENSQESQNEQEEENLLTEEEQNTEELKQNDTEEFIEDSNSRSESKNITPAQVQMISEKLGKDWKKLAGRFGYKSDEIEFIEKEFGTVGEQAMHLLNLWISDDEDANLDNLLYTLEGLQLQEVADAVREEINAFV